MPSIRSAQAHLRAAAAFFTGLLVHCSLDPYAGWRTPGAAAWDYWLGASILPHHRFYPLDAALNVLAYIPLGGLVLASLPRGWRRFAWASTAAWIACTGLSAGLELTQAFLPGRVSSKVDLACNSLGAAVGVALARGMLGLPRRVRAAWEPAVNRLCEHLDWEATLTLGIWLLCLLSPLRVPFVMGPWLGVFFRGRLDPGAGDGSGPFVAFLASLAGLTGALTLGLSQIPSGRRRLPTYGLLVFVAGFCGWLLPQIPNLAAGLPLPSPLKLWGQIGVASVAAAMVLGACLALSNWPRRRMALLSLLALCATVACTAALPGESHLGMRPEAVPARRIVGYLLSAADRLGAVWSALGALAAWRLSRKAS